MHSREAPEDLDSNRGADGNGDGRANGASLDLQVLRRSLEEHSGTGWKFTNVCRLCDSKTLDSKTLGNL